MDEPHAIEVEIGLLDCRRHQNPHREGSIIRPRFVVVNSGYDRPKNAFISGLIQKMSSGIAAGMVHGLVRPKQISTSP